MQPDQGSAPAFTIGTFPPKTDAQRRKDRIKNAKAKSTKFSRSTETLSFHPPNPVSVLCFSKHFPQPMSFVFALVGKTLTERYYYMKDLLVAQANFQKKRKEHPNTPVPFNASPYMVQFQQEVQTWFRLERQVRFALKRLVNAFLFKRYKKRLLNTEDPATLEPPRQEIRIFDVKSRGTYLFEASTLKRQWDENLGYAKWMVPEPQLPKNPLTNLPFTLGQLIYIAQELRRLGRTSWLIEGFIQFDFQRKAFLEQFNQTLRLHTLTRCFNDPKHEDTIDFLEEFMEDEFEYHDIEFRAYLTILRWGIRNAMETRYMKQWLQTWYDYYKLFILHGPSGLRTSPGLLDATHDMTEDLFRNTKAISALSKLRLAQAPQLDRVRFPIPPILPPPESETEEGSLRGLRLRIRLTIPSTPAENQFVRAVEELVRHEPPQDS